MRYMFFMTLVFAGVLNAEIQFSHRTHPYHTHQPVLYEMATRTTGPIIEFGCGYGSTDMLHEICKDKKRLLVSLDSDFEWLSTFSKKYQNDSEWHKFIFVPERDKTDPGNAAYWVKFLESSAFLRTTQFDLCFIDQDPWLGRFETLKFMKDKAKYIILHDCDYFPGFGIFGKMSTPYVFEVPREYDFSDVFKFFKVYHPLKPWPGDAGPPTLLGSDFESNLPDINYNNY